MDNESSSNSRDTARRHNPTHFGGEGLYETPGNPVSPGAARRASRTVDFVKRNPEPLLAIGGLAWLLVKLVRRSTQG